MTLKATIGFALISVAVSAQTPREQPGDVPFTSVKFQIGRRAVDTVLVHVENLRDSPLVFWRFQVGSSTMTENRIGSGSTADDGPILPGKIRATNMEPATAGQNLPPAAVLFAVFEDGWVEGTPQLIEDWTTARRQQAAEAAHWQDVIARARRVSEAEGRELLRAAVVERRQQIAEGRTAQGAPWKSGAFDSWSEPRNLLSMVQSVTDDRTDRSSDWFAGRLAALARDVQARRVEMIRPQFHPPAPSTTENAVPSVAIRVLIEPVTKVFVTIENLRDVPIEAFEYETYSSPLRPTAASGASHDNCGVEGIGNRIRPHEVRTIELGDHAVTPTARLNYVLFDDLVFEGRIEGREALFRRRELRAEEYAYWIGVLDEVRSKSPADVRAFMNQRQRERIVATSQNPGVVGKDAMQVADAAERSAETFGRRVDDTRARFERMRQALTRHRR